MKVVAFNGSPRKEGNTYHMLKTCLKELEAEGIETEIVQMGAQSVHGCIVCDKCIKNKDNKCAITNDGVNDWMAKMIDADGILLGSPTYFANVSAPMKALIDRIGRVGLVNGGLLRRKVGAAVVAVRRAGALPAFNAINHLFFISQMVVPGSCYWNLGIGLKPGDVKDDEEGQKTMTLLGQNMAWLLKKIRS